MISVMICLLSMELTFIDVALNILEMFFCMEFIM